MQSNDSAENRSYSRASCSSSRSRLSVFMHGDGCFRFLL